MSLFVRYICRSPFSNPLVVVLRDLKALSYRYSASHLRHNTCGSGLKETPSVPQLAWGTTESADHVNTALEILATSLEMRLTPEELEWLSMALKERAEQRRREAGSEMPVLAGYRDAWEPVRRSAA